MLCKKLLGIAGFTIGSIHIARLDVIENVCPQHSNRTQSCFCGFHLFVELVNLIHLILYRCAKQIILEEVVVFQIVDGICNFFCGHYLRPDTRILCNDLDLKNKVFLHNSLTSRGMLA